MTQREETNKVATSHLTIQPASTEDLPQIRSLLGSVGLPDEGVAEHLEDFLVAKDESGRLIGTVGLESHGVVGLLRSLAVSPDHQGCGLGQILVTESLKRAATRGIHEIVLLTLTAPDFFGKYFGFVPANRIAYTEALSNSVEMQMSCCSNAVFMKRDLRTTTQKNCEL